MRGDTHKLDRKTVLTFNTFQQCADSYLRGLMQRWVQFKRKSCPQIARIMQLLSPLILTIISFLSEYDLSLYVCVQL